MAVRIIRGHVILPDRLLERGRVVVEDGIIQAVDEDTVRSSTTDDAGDLFIAPGFIDVHTHGIAGADTMDATQSALSAMARRYASHGVTGFLPTTMTQSAAATVQALQAVCRYMELPEGQEPSAAQILGIHMEGPWISPQFKGAQNEDYIVLPGEEAINSFLAHGTGSISIVTLAPELPGAEQAIRTLRQHSVCVSIGHTGATYEQALHAFDMGASQVTHCFNAMTPLHHRQPGVVGAVFRHREVCAELIADGVHVHPAMMRLLIDVIGRERVMLITDSMAATDLPDGTYALGGQDAYVRDGQARLQDGTLAGSTLTLDRAVRNIVQLCDVPLLDAVYMASTVPAQAIGIGDRKGKICPGYDADLTILDAKLCPVRIMIGGHTVDFAGDDNERIRK